MKTILIILGTFLAVASTATAQEPGKEEREKAEKQKQKEQEQMIHEMHEESEHGMKEEFPPEKKGEPKRVSPAKRLEKSESLPKHVKVNESLPEPKKVVHETVEGPPLGGTKAKKEHLPSKSKAEAEAYRTKQSQALDNAIIKAEDNIETAKAKIKAAKDALEDDKKFITMEQYQERQQKIEEAEKVLKLLEEKTAKGKTLKK